VKLDVILMIKVILLLKIPRISEVCLYKLIMSFLSGLVPIYLFKCCTESLQKCDLYIHILEIIPWINMDCL